MYIFEGPLKTTRSFDNAVSNSEQARKHIIIKGFDYPNSAGGNSRVLFDLNTKFAEDRKKLLDNIRGHYPKAKIV